jgi:hypothetical protein
MLILGLLHRSIAYTDLCPMKTCGVDDFTVKDVENLHDNYSEVAIAVSGDLTLHPQSMHISSDESNICGWTSSLSHIDHNMLY